MQPFSEWECVFVKMKKAGSHRSANQIIVQYGSGHRAFKIHTFITYLSNNLLENNFRKNDGT